MRALRFAAIAAVAVALPAVALAQVEVREPYALSANPQSGAAFMVLVNPGPEAERLIEARSPVAARVELHTHLMRDGVARMVEVEAIEIPAGAETRLERGGLHVMFLGLHQPLAPGDTAPITLVFESGAEIEVEAPVQAPRPMAHGRSHGHGRPASD